jgi:putative NADH-flavin reductase
MDSPAKPVIALFGASGKTGRQFLALALQQGYPVRALARTPGQLPPTGPQLAVVPGDVLNPDDVDRVLQGADVVVSVFGQVKGSPPTVQTDGTRHIVAAMQRHGVARIVSLSGGGLPFTLDKPKLPDRLIRGLMRLLVPQVLRDAAGHAQVLQQSDRQWVIVRAPRLTGAPATGRYRVGWVGVNSGTSLTRPDLAAFLLTQLDDDHFLGQMPMISN